MSRSYHKMCSTKGIFCNWVCYKSNKKDKLIANRKIRKYNKQQLHIAILEDNYDDYILLNNPRETSDVWDFSSDGLKRFIRVRQIDKDLYIISNYPTYNLKLWTLDELKKYFFSK